MAGLDRNWETKVLLIKSEVVTGTDPIPTVADNAILAYNAALTLDADEKTRSPDKGFFSAPEKTFTNKRFGLTFEVEVAGSGTAGTAPKISPILLMAGMSETIVALTSVEYKPVTGSTETATFYLNIDGTLYKSSSCKASIKIDEAIDDYGKMTVTVVGFYLSPVDSPLLPGDFSGFIPPVDNTEKNTVMNINGINVDGVTFSYDQGNSNALKQSTETKVINNDDRQGTADVSVWINEQSYFNPYPLFENHTKVPVFFEAGIVAGNIVRITLPNAQLSAPQVANLNGVAGYNISLTPHSTAAGDDEFSILLT